VRSRFERAVDLLEHLGARQAPVAVGHRAPELGGQQVGVPRPPGQGLADQPFGLAEAIDIGGVDQVDPELQSPMQTGDVAGSCLAFAEAEPSAERDLGHLEVAGAQSPVAHSVSPQFAGRDAGPAPDVLTGRA
jgi:hypothetical protein